MQCGMQAGSFAVAECSSRQAAAPCKTASWCRMQAFRRPTLAMRVTSSSFVQQGSLMQRTKQRQRPSEAASRLLVVATYPEPETEKERSPIDYPQEWITPQPSRRPDIFPEFEKLQTPMPKPMPGDPEMPDEEEEEEKEKKPDKEDPDEDKPKPDEPAPSEE